MDVSVQGMKSRLFLRLAAILVILAGLLFYSYSTVIRIIQTGREEIVIVNAIGRQRMLVQQFVRQANMALIGLSISDWETLLQQRKLSEETSGEFERTMQALLNGGSVKIDESLVTIPKVEAKEVRARLDEIDTIWEEVKRASVKVLRSSNKQLRDHPDLALMQTEASALVHSVDQTLSLMQQRSLQRDDALARHQTFLLIGGIGIFGLLALFVYGSIISPLGNTIEKLDKSEEQHRHLYDSAPVGLWKADMKSGRFLKVNVAMAELAGAPSESWLIESGNFLSLFPTGKAQELYSQLRKHGQVAEFEVSIHNGAGAKATLISARLYPGGTVAEGAAVDITERKQAETELESTHKLLVETAHQAGMANIATSVLHNVGNVLNSLNVSCSLAQERLDKSRTKGLSDAVALLRQALEGHPPDEVKQLQIADYLQKLAEYFANDKIEFGREINSMQDNIDHIRTIICLQQTFAKGRTFVETVRPAEIFEEALAVNMTAIMRHHVCVHREFADIPPVELERHKILQILVNLISNAKQAMEQKAPDDKRLGLKLWTPDPGTICFEVSDNGVGFASEAAKQFFQHGFTTRPDGHGFGLHSSALAATEMGGDLTAESAGPGRGAHFTLKLPYRCKDAPQDKVETQNAPAADLSTS